MIWRKVRHGVANRSALASINVRSMPDSRARTSRSTRLVLKSTWAAMIVVCPNLGRSPVTLSIRSKPVANRTSVASAITISGTITLM